VYYQFIHCFAADRRFIERLYNAFWHAPVCRVVATFDALEKFRLSAGCGSAQGLTAAPNTLGTAAETATQLNPMLSK
jgi:hypothetical protein